MHKAKAVRAAQYIRMSTDTQNLSPAIQKEAIRAYAHAAGLELVESYEDEGRSGLTLRNRAEMRRLLADVAADDCPFSVVLVYDVSRWGRFQDTDESAYYEYHCRLHGVEVVYVMEPFVQERTPLTTLLKALKRTMAAEFSRELAIKVKHAQRRAVTLGFQIGRTPCIGIDRMAVAADGLSRRVLDGRERARKGERISWVRGAAHELALVRRIFEEYVSTSITLSALAEKLRREGHTARGKAFTLTMLKCLIDCEIFYGEFTWGRRKSGARAHRRIDTDPGFIRAGGVMDPIVPKELWDAAQEKRAYAFHHFNLSKSKLLADLQAALARNPGLTATELRGSNCAPLATYRNAFGSIREAMRLAGRDDAALRKAYLDRKSRTHRLAKQFKWDFAGLLTSHGVQCETHGNEQLFTVGSGLKVRFRLIWQRRHRGGLKWHFERVPLGVCDFILIVPVQEAEFALELVLLTPVQYKALCTWFASGESVGGRRFSSGQALVEELKICSERRLGGSDTPASPRSGLDIDQGRSRA